MGEVLYSQPIFTARTAELAPDRTADDETFSYENAAFNKHQAHVLAEVIAETEDQVADFVEKKLGEAVAALREEMQIEIALARDEVMSRLDQKLYGRGLTDDFDPEAIQKAVHELRVEFDTRADVVGARIAALVDQFGASERRAEQRNADLWRGLAQQQVALARMETQGAEPAKRLDQTVEELRALRAILADADIMAPEPPAAAFPALPPPA
jgi:hypothetical protein